MVTAILAHFGLARALAKCTRIWHLFFLLRRRRVTETTCRRIPKMLRARTTMTTNQTSESILPEAGRTAAQECAAIEADLERLKRLVNDAAGRLLGSFNEFASLEQQTIRNLEERQRIESAIGSAVTALQFQDMATQLTGHAQRRLVALENCLRSLYGEMADAAISEHPQPVRQAEMSAGSVDLF